MRNVDTGPATTDTNCRRSPLSAQAPSQRTAGSERGLPPAREARQRHFQHPEEVVPWKREVLGRSGAWFDDEIEWIGGVVFESGSKMVIVVPEGLEARVRDVARLILHAPFTKRTWSEFLFLCVGIPLAFFGLAFVVLTMAAGVALAITFVGLAVIGLSVRGARG